jgi:hypothetical protein
MASHEVAPLARLIGTGIGGAALSVVMGLIYFIVFYAWSEGIMVFLDIEENTRTTVAAVDAIPVGRPISPGAPVTTTAMPGQQQVVQPVGTLPASPPPMPAG